MGFVVSAHKARKALTLSRTAAHPQASFFADPDCADVFGSASAPVSPNFLSLHSLKHLLLTKLHPLFLLPWRYNQFLLILGELLWRHDTLEELERLNHVCTGWCLRGWR